MKGALKDSRTIEAKSDHNTITAKIKSAYKEITMRTIEKWKINNESNWGAYDKKLEELQHTDDEPYQKLEQAIQKSLEKAIGKKIIKSTSKGKQ